MPLSILPLQNFKPHGYQPMHISRTQVHGVQRPDTLLQRDAVSCDVGNG